MMILSTHMPKVHPKSLLQSQNDRCHSFRFKQCKHWTYIEAAQSMRAKLVLEAFLDPVFILCFLVKKALGLAFGL